MSFELDPQARNAQIKERERKRLERERNDLIHILSAPQGRRFVWKLMSYAGVFKGSFTGTSETFFKEGQRDIGLLILRELMIAKADAFTQMQREHASDELNPDNQKGNP